MIPLNLSTSTPEEEKLKTYLEENASATLAEKINNGVPVTKDGKPLTSKKDLKSFMAYASQEAQKLVEQGARYAMVDDNTVFGWAIHYFEEDSIEGKLYTLDGSEYKPEVKKPTLTPTITPKPTPAPVKKEEKPQLSLFDMMSTEETTPVVTEEPKRKTVIVNENGTDVLVDEETGEILDNDDIEEAIETAEREEESYGKKVNPMYSRYMEIKKRYEGIVAMRVGDFYEILGDDAVKIGQELELTITSRDLGLEYRTPMIGFPYHACDAYFAKIISNHKLVIAEYDKEPIVKEKEITTPVVDDEDDNFEEELKEINSAINKEAMMLLYDRFDGCLDIQ